MRLLLPRIIHFSIEIFEKFLFGGNDTFNVGGRVPAEGRGRPPSARMNSGRLLGFNRKYRIMNAGHICWSILGNRPSFFFLPTNKNRMNNNMLSFLKKCLIKSLVNAFLEYFHFWKKKWFTWFIYETNKSLDRFVIFWRKR